MKSGGWYEGNWTNDLAQGFGHYRSASGCSYKGDWLNDK